METTHHLNQFLTNLASLEPKKEVHTQSKNQGIFLQFRQFEIFINGGPVRLELVAVAVVPDFDFFVYVVISDSSRRKRI